MDPQWKKLLDGTITFEQAMDKGHSMPEKDREGILGVDLMTSERMGLKNLDPRWKSFLDHGVDAGRRKDLVLAISM